jgi:hypothetical protein
MQRRLPIAALLLLWALCSSAAAQEYCVTCAGPPATYRCVVAGDGSAAAHAARGQFLCITEIAKSGGHASCSAARGQASPCPGETRTVMFSLGEPGTSPLEASPTPSAKPLFVPVPSANELPPVALPPQQAQPAAPPPPVETGTAAPVPPKPSMVEDLANKTGKAVNDTGKAVGGAVKKSWDCVASLFGDC